ncbi:hypothetical protein JCM17961_21630 [Endothiovibrio diazotrophicus]
MFDLTPLLPLRALTITLRFTAPAHFRFFHQPALTAFVRSLLDSPDDYDTRLTIDTAESGRTDYLAGDRYRFSVTALPGGEGLLDRLVERLRQLPAGAPLTDRMLPLRDNVELESCVDLFTGEAAERAGGLAAYDAAALERECALWSEAPTPLYLRWLSPARLLRAKEERKDATGEHRFCRDPHHLDGPLLAARLHDALADLLRRRGETPAPRDDVAPLQLPAADLFWVAAGYRDEAGGEHAMGGVLGQLLLHWDAPPMTDWWRRLVLGQYLGIGQRRSFGWGRYRLETREADHTLTRVEAADTLLRHAARPDNLLAAHRAMEENRARRAPRPPLPEEDEEEPWDGEVIDETEEATDDDEREAALAETARTLTTPAYRVPPLKGVVARDPDGELRALAVPPFRDRVAQRAVAQTLGPALDGLMYEASFGFRPGRSRHDAARRIQALYREGYRWVFESDIDDFFDSVDLSHLALRLECLYHDDALVARLMAWMGAPVVYRGERIERRRGLPQGSPLSPLLANLMLDDFDHDLQARGFRLVRFADDFVVLAKRREQADEAAALVRRSLADWGLTLNEAKTRVIPFEQGFRYLGFLFMNELVLDVGGRYAKGDAPPPPPPGWLARVPVREPLPLKGFDAASPAVAPAAAGRAPTGDAPAAIGERGEAGTLVVVSGEPALVTTHEGRLNIARDEETLLDLPFDHAEALLLVGRHHITTPALRAALEHGLPVHFATARGHYEGCAWNGRAGADGSRLWLLQQQRMADPSAALTAARALVSARLTHQREVLRQAVSRAAGGEAAARQAEAIARQLPTVESAADLAALNGVEGTAARAYFTALAARIPAEWGFAGRNRRPPRDPFNALLSLGYTVLYAHVESLLRVDGLLPWIGVYHQPHGRHAVLASDLMEPFRHLVERAALAAALRRRLDPERDFVLGERGCFLTKEARRRWLTLLEERFQRPVTARGDDHPRPLHQQLHRQNRALIAWIRGEAERFTPFRQR